MNANMIKDELNAVSNVEQAAQLSRFFKTAPGQYGAGDIFIGVQVPKQREIAKKYKGLSLNEIEKLITSKIHEHRFTGLVILVELFTQSQEEVERQEIVDFYLAHLKWVNNWDLVDLSAPRILGKYLLLHPTKRKMLFSMAQSTNLWERRVAVLATAPMIMQSQFKELLFLAERLLNDSHDLIHKAVGWMLREAGKVNLNILEGFLEKHANSMPRTMLRYSIERLEPSRRKYFMKCS